MPNTRRLMRQVREILRLKYGQGLPHRAIARACGIGLGTVSEYCRRAERAGLTWPLSDDLATPSWKPGSSSGSTISSGPRGRSPTWPGSTRSSRAPG